jgi:adenylate cyclase
LKGQYSLGKRTLPALRQAVDYFQQAIVKDPKDARAYSGLANSYTLLTAYSAAPQEDHMPKARAAALEALRINDQLPEAHTALALIVQNYDWDWRTAEQEFRRAIELSPNYATAHHWYSEHLMWRGKFEDALQESERARQLDPLSLIIAADRGAILYYSRQYDRAINQFLTVLDMDPHFPRAHLISDAYADAKRYAEALAYLEKQRSTMAPPWYWSSLAYVHARSAQTAPARRALQQLLRLNARQPVDPTVIAWVYTSLGEKAQALARLEKAYAQHSNGLTALKIDPAYDSLRNDPGFRNLLTRVGLHQ